MNLSNRTALLLVLAAAGVSAGSLMAACSSSSSGNGFGNGDASTPGEGGGGGACPNPTVPIIFAPMYSAYIPGSSAQTFEIPAITGDGIQATWTASQAA